MPRAKQERLPGVESAIPALEKAAEKYAELRDSRQEILREEVEYKGKLLEIMKKHGKEVYERDGIKIEIVHEEETVKVKIKKPKDEDVI